jgi:glycosyltransferase involved in cell wall biosynthesis
VIGAFDEWLCDSYKSYTPELSVVNLPAPHDGAVNQGRPAVLTRIGFFGHQRPARGLDLMPELVRRLLDRGYEVVVQDSAKGADQGHRHPRLDVLPYIKDFAAEIARCDLVIWPSRWQGYTTSCSGVVSESIASGVPVILPSGCLPATVAARHGCGTFFHDHTVESVLLAVDEVAADFPRLLERARRGAASWHETNGTARLVDAIEAHAERLS